MITENACNHNVFFQFNQWKKSFKMFSTDCTSFIYNYWGWSISIFRPQKIDAQPPRMHKKQMPLLIMQKIGAPTQILHPRWLLMNSSLHFFTNINLSCGFILVKENKSICSKVIEVYSVFLECPSYMYVIFLSVVKCQHFYIFYL